MPQSYPVVPSFPALARLARHGLILLGAGLAVSTSSASAATSEGSSSSGGAEAGAPAGAGSSTAAPRAAARSTTKPKRTKPTRATVRSVQRKLRVRADGVYGARTRAAVRRYQRRRKLVVDGRLNPETLVALGVVARAARVPDAPTLPANAAGLLEAIAKCESGGDPTAVSADGQYRGKYQFLISTWEAMGGTGDPAAAPEAEQDQRAAALLAAEGTKPWPVCGRQAQSAQ